MEYKVTTVNITKEDIRYCKEKEINMSSFLRQAIHAHKQGKLEYNGL